MKSSEYKLNGDVPESLKGLTFKFKAAETMDDLRAQVKDGADEHVVASGQASIDITKQRLLRAKAGSEDVANILAGKAEGTAELDADGRKSAAQTFLQDFIDGYVYGSRAPGSGESAKLKKSAKVGDAVVAAAAADPELAVRLHNMGVELPEEVLATLREQGLIPAAAA